MARTPLVRAGTSGMKYVRNIQGRPVELELVEVGPDEISLDPTNPRIQLAMQQLGKTERNDAACSLVLIAQEETESLKASIIRSGGVQEPIYIRHDGLVAEGNRRVVAMRMAHEERPNNPQFTRLPAWRIPKNTPEKLVQDLLNEIHIGSVRGWAPFEKASQIRGLVRDGSLLVHEVAERYRMTTSQVEQQIAAAEAMEENFFTIVDDKTDPNHRSKYSYFLEFEKNTRIQKIAKAEPDLRGKFAEWVRDGRIAKGVQVRSLPKILESPTARRLLMKSGFKAAKNYLSRHDPEEHDLYARSIEITEQIGQLSLDEIEELKISEERQQVFLDLRKQIDVVLKHTR